jgi:hypothetical protein
MGKRGPKPSGAATTSTQRMRRWRAARAQRFAPPDEPLLKLARGASEMGYSEIANEVAAALLDKFNEALGRNDAGSDRRYVQGHRLGIQQCVALTEAHRDEIFKFWGKPMPSLRRPVPDVVDEFEAPNLDPAMTDLDEHILNEMVSFGRKTTGIDNTIFISPADGSVKVAVDPPNTLDPTRPTASIAILDGTLSGARIDPKLYTRVLELIDLNRDALIEYCEYKIDTGDLVKRFKAVTQCAL